MLVKKCDNCKKEIKGHDEAVVVVLGWPESSFDLHIRLTDGNGNYVVAECIPSLPCERPKVGPIIAFLKKRKLLQPKTTG